MPSDRRLNLRTYAPLVAAAVLSACSGRKPPTGSAAPEPQAYLFSYFTRNGEDGVHLAYSRDGISWAALNGGKFTAPSCIRTDCRIGGLAWVAIVASTVHRRPGFEGA